MSEIKLPVRMTDPREKDPDTIASTPAEYSNLRYGHGFVVSQDQRPLDAEDSVAGNSGPREETPVVESEKPAAKQISAKPGAPKNTNDAGKDVATA